MRNLPLNLEQEALSITGELGNVAFVGAFAVNHYVSYRSTRAIDLAISSPIDESKLVRLGYTKWETRKATSWITPRRIKVDFYTKDVGRIPVNWILKNAELVQRGSGSYKVICLEGIILAKHRAGRTADIADLRQLLTRRSDSVRWSVMEEIAKPTETAELRKLSDILSSRGRTRNAS